MNNSLQRTAETVGWACECRKLNKSTKPNKQCSKLAFEKFCLLVFGMLRVRAVFLLLLLLLFFFSTYPVAFLFSALTIFARPSVTGCVCVSMNLRMQFTVSGCTQIYIHTIRLPYEFLMHRMRDVSANGNVWLLLMRFISLYSFDTGVWSLFICKLLNKVQLNLP